MPDLSPVLLFARPLNRLGAAYMIVGSVASIAYGEIRTTNDVDLVLEFQPRDAVRIATEYPAAEFYCPPEEVLRIESARAHRGHFNVIHHATGFKADFYLKNADALSDWAMRNRRRIVFEGEELSFAPPEYVILGKLQFFREGGSEKHLRDIASMLEITEVDREFVSDHAARLGVVEEWRRCG